MACKALRKLWAELFPVEEEEVKKGRTGEDVEEIQQLLGLSLVDGVFGSGTERAVKSFQAENGLFPDGEVGPKTLEVLRLSKEPVSFQAVADLLPRVFYQTYKLKGGQIPEQPRGVSLKPVLVGSETINCTQFTTWVVSNTFETTFSSRQWATWQVSSDAAETGRIPNYGPRVAVEWGIGSTRPGKGPWLVQFFTSTKTFAGHSMLVIDHDPETDKILTLEANLAYGLNGVGWGEIGNLRDVLNPGKDWPTKVRQTWASRLASKPALHIVQLSIDPDSIQEWLA